MSDSLPKKRGGKRPGAGRKRKHPTFDEMLKSQSGLCGLCGKPLSGRIHRDHDHKTGKRRDLLHHACNLLLGFVHDDPEFLWLAIKYLLRHSGK